MSKYRAVLALLVLAAVACGQKQPSAKTLREKLATQVKRYSLDGRFIASWTFDKAEQLKSGFNVEGGRRARIDGKSLLIDGKTDGGVAVLFRELAFKAPLKLEVEVYLETSGASFVLNLLSTDDKQDQLFTFCNTSIYSNTTDKFDGTWEVVDGKPKDTQRSGPSRWVAKQWTPVAIEMARNGDVTVRRRGLTIGSARGWKPSSFSVMLSSYRGKARVRNLSVDGKVDVASVRKLFRSVTAKEESKQNKKPRRTGFAILQFERNLDDAKIEVDVSGRAGGHVKKGLRLLRDGKNEQAASAFSRAEAEKKRAGEDPDPMLGYLRGEAYRAAGKLDLATRAWTEATDPAPGAGLAWLALGEAHLEEGEVAAALRCANAAITADSELPWPHLLRALVFLQRGDLKGAEAEVRHLKKKRGRSRGADVLLEEFKRIRKPPEWAKTYTKKNKWYVVQTNISDKLCASFRTQLFHYRRFLESHFPLPSGRRGGQSKVWVFDSEEGYRQFAAALGNRSEHTAGVYHSGLRTLMLIGRLSADDTRDTLFHEAFHQYLHLAVDRAPWWLNEGLAEYYGATTFDRSRKPKVGGIQKGRLATLKSRMRKGPIVEFAKLMQMGPTAFMQPDRASLHYAQSWAMVHFFRHGGRVEWREMFRRYVELVLENKSPKKAYAETFASLEPTDWGELVNAFRRYVEVDLSR